jgi:hypothetical protein
MAGLKFNGAYLWLNQALGLLEKPAWRLDGNRQFRVFFVCGVAKCE